MPTPLVVQPEPTRPFLPKPETSVQGTIAATPEGESPEASAADGLVITPGMTWGEVFNSFTEDEQACVRSELGDERVARLMDQPLGVEGLQDAPQTVLGCISDDKARELLLANLADGFGGLTAQQETCVRGLLADFSPADLAEAMGPEPTQEQGLLMMSFLLGMVTCVPEMAQASGPGQMPGGENQADPPLWSFTSGGWVVTAPAVVDGVVYAGSDDFSLYALDAGSGSLRWSFATGDVVRSTPTVVDGRVYFGSNDNHLYALDAESGSELWKYDTGDWVQYSPAVAGGMVYFGAKFLGDRRVHAVDAATGEVTWVARHPFPIGARHTPTPLGDKVYAPGSEYGQFYAYNAATGHLEWDAEVGGYVESAPIVVDSVVYLTVANRAYAFNEGTGEVIWEVNTEEFPARDFPALVVDGVYYLAPSDKVYALNSATGEEIWSYQSGMLSTAPVVADGVLYGASEPEQRIFALNAATGEELWTESTGNSTVNALTVEGEALYGELSSGSLIAAGVGDGARLWEFEKGGFSDLRGYTVVDGVVYSAGPNNGVYAHRAPQG